MSPVFIALEKYSKPIPSLSSTVTNDKNLTLPIVPDQHRDFRPLITYIYSDRPKGFELASSLATTIYHYWKDTVNARIAGTITSRRLPFSQFLHTVQPSLNPGTVLNTVKVGLAYCFLLQGIIEKTPASWPGHMAVRILDTSGFGTQKREIGVILVGNNPDDDDGNGEADAEPEPEPGNGTPEILTSTPSTPSLSTPQQQQLSAPIPTEKRWLTCFAKVLFFFTRHSPKTKFTDDQHLAPSPTPVAYYWPCDPNHKDEMTVTVFPAASRVLTWDTLVRSMLDWVNEAAMQPWGHLFSEEVMQDGVTMGSLTIKLGREGLQGEKQNEGTDKVTTA
ncbi:MAG: hypothetical protein Q9221_003633 [Calogaya cf. arnoldii]